MNAGRHIPASCLLTPQEAAFVTGSGVEDLTAQFPIVMVGDQPRFRAWDVLGIGPAAHGVVAKIELDSPHATEAAS